MPQHPSLLVDKPPQKSVNFPVSTIGKVDKYRKMYAMLNNLITSM